MPKFAFSSSALLVVTLSIGSISQAGWTDYFKRSSAKTAAHQPSIKLRAFRSENGAVVVQVGSRLFYGANGVYSEQGIIGWGLGGSDQASSYIAVEGQPNQEGHITDEQLTLFTDRQRGLNRKTYPRLDAESEKNLTAEFETKKILILRDSAREPKMVFEGMTDGKTWTLLIDKSTAYNASSSAPGFANDESQFAGPTNLERVYIGTGGHFTPVAIEKSERHFPHFEYLVKPNGDIIQLLRSPTVNTQGQPNGVKIVATFENSEGNAVIAERVMNARPEQFASAGIDGYSNGPSHFKFIGQPLNGPKAILRCEELF